MITGWSGVDRIGYLEGETTVDGGPSLDEVVLHGANVHLEKMDDQSFVLIAETETHEYRVWIGARSGRARVDGTIEITAKLRG